MSRFNAKFSAGKFRDALRRLPAELQRTLTERLDKLGDELIHAVEGGSPAERRQKIARALEWQMKSVFIPVQLQHQRREMWPDLHTIYRARIVRGQTTYMGRKRFHVDEMKEHALYQELLASALRRRPGQRFVIRFARTYDHRVRLEIIKRGKFSQGELTTLIVFARTRVRPASRESLALAMERARLKT